MSSLWFAAMLGSFGRITESTKAPAAFLPLVPSPRPTPRPELALASQCTAAGHDAAATLPANPTGAVGGAETLSLEDQLAREAMIDPRATADLALLLPPGKTQADALAAAVLTWARTNPVATAAWVTALPEGPLRTLATERLVPTWADSSMEGALAWIAGLPAGGSSDVARRIVAHLLVDEDPDLALTLADSIHGGFQRDHWLERLGREWLRRDPIAATAALAKSSLPAERRQALLAENQ